MKNKILIVLLLTLSMIGCNNHQVNDSTDINNYTINETSQENENTDEVNHKLIYSQEDLLALLAEKLDLNVEDYEYQGEDYLGGYTYTYLMKEGEVGNPMTYVVDPLTGNVYDEISEAGIINLFIDNSHVDENVILENILKNYCESNLKVWEDGYYAGNIKILIYKSTTENKFHEVGRLVVNPFTLDVMNYETKEVIGNLYDEHKDKISD